MRPDCDAALWVRCEAESFRLPAGFIYRPNSECVLSKLHEPTKISGKLGTKFQSVFFIGYEFRPDVSGSHVIDE